MMRSNTAIGRRLLLLGLLSAVLMTLDHQQRHIEAIRGGLSLVVAPLQFAVHFPGYLYDYTTETLQSRNTLLAENASYHEQQLYLKARLQRLEALEKENQRLRHLLKSAARAGDRVLVAKLLQIDPDPFSHRVILDKGAQQGIYQGQPIIDANGVLGQITKVGPTTSVALLLTDVSHAVPVESNRSGVRSIAVGTGKLNQLELRHATSTFDLMPGDLLVTSGLGQRFPAGYPVGRIVDIEKNSALPFVKVTIKPSADLERAREVLLVWPEGSAREPLPQVTFSLPEVDQQVTE